MRNETHRLQGADIRLLRHVDRLGDRHVECAPAAAERRRSSKSAAKKRSPLFGQFETEQERETPSLRYSTLLAVVHARLAKTWGVRAHADLHDRFGGSIPGLAGLPGFGRGARLSQAPLQARHPFERRSRELRHQQQEARRDLRRRLHGRGCRLLQARSAQLRLHARTSGNGSRASGNRRSCTRPRACITTTCRRSAPAWRAPGSTGASAKRAAAPR